MSRQLKTVNEFDDWLASKPKRGDRVQYCRGFLAESRGARDWGNSKTVDTEILIDYVWQQYRSGKVTLVQQRFGAGDYAYYAVAT